MPVFVVAPVPPPALPVCVVGIAVVVVAAPVLGVDAGPDGAYLAQNVVSSVQPPVFPVCIGVVVEGFSEAQVPVVGSNCESPVHLVPVLPPVFPVCVCVVFICVVAVVVPVVLPPVFPVCIGVVVEGFSEAQVPVVGSNCESPVHLVPVLPPVFPVCIGVDDGVVVVVPVLPPVFAVFICVVVVVFPVFSVCIGVVDWFFGTHLPTELSIKSSGHVC
jgi:hypothetical protein